MAEDLKLLFEVELKLDSLGFFLRPDESDEGNKWTASASVKFATADERYSWLDKLVGVWNGVFDMDSYRHHYHVFAAN